MKWDEVLKLFKDQPVIETFMLGNDPKELFKIRVQLSRWVEADRLIKIRNGMYALSDRYRTGSFNKEYVATFATKPSYISFEYALASYDLIPEYVPNITLVTTKRPQKLQFAKNYFIYKHIQPELFWGYSAKGDKNFETFYADPEKALLDLFYFTKGGLTPAYMEEMRFQNTEVLDLQKLTSYTKRFDRPRITQAVELFKKFVEKESEMKEL